MSRRNFIKTALLALIAAISPPFISKRLPMKWRLVELGVSHGIQLTRIETPFGDMIIGKYVDDEETTSVNPTVSEA